MTLQNIYRTLHILTANYRISSLPKQDKLNISITYYDAIRQNFLTEWSDYKEYRLTHIVCLDALSLAGNKVLLQCMPEGKKRIDLSTLPKIIRKMTVDWSAQGSLKYLKGMSGSKTLASDLIEQMKIRNT
ncbi:hypothetical protein [Paenibacillus macquariensis]|uniref:hypothetical protein n=1 Tax=Paenibacillus macquariensis TaxID=948756 RepID=UPI0012E7E2FE|nr:hypothetical protein [Paenibacillus macquariensis]